MVEGCFIRYSIVVFIIFTILWHYFSDLTAPLDLDLVWIQNNCCYIKKNDNARKRPMIAMAGNMVVFIFKKMGRLNQPKLIFYLSPNQNKVYIN